ncbi:unnamed protein product, partial [Allacma fusca]
LLLYSRWVYWKSVITGWASKVIRCSCVVPTLFQICVRVYWSIRNDSVVVSTRLVGISGKLLLLSIVLVVPVGCRLFSA